MAQRLTTAILCATTAAGQLPGNTMGDGKPPRPRSSACMSRSNAACRKQNHGQLTSRISKAFAAHLRWARGTSFVPLRLASPGPTGIRAFKGRFARLAAEKTFRSSRWSRRAQRPQICAPSLGKGRIPRVAALDELNAEQEWAPSPRQLRWAMANPHKDTIHRTCCD